MLQQKRPDDFVFATGQSRKLVEFVEKAFALVGLEWQDHVFTDPRLLRPSNLSVGRGDSGKAWKQLGWRARHNMDDVVRMMVEAEMNGGAQL